MPGHDRFPSQAAPIPISAPLCLLALCFLLTAWLPAHRAEPFVYTLRPGVNLRQEATTASAALLSLTQNETLAELERQSGWVKVRTLNGLEGWVRQDLVSNLWVRVIKDERLLEVFRGWEQVAVYRVALCPFNPLGDKVRQGDGGTPEGRFFVCESLREPGQAKYGARSLRLSYPNAGDARAGLAAGLIDRAQYLAIIRALDQGRMPPQDTALGGSIRIHGGSGAGSSDRDWTLGCIGLADKDVIALYDLLPRAGRVEVYHDRAQAERAADPRTLPRLVADGARDQLAEPSLYTRQAMNYAPLDYPLGDIDPAQGVCADVAIRALRAAGLDLQALMHEDMLLRPEAYAEYAAIFPSGPDPNIDQRRVRAMRIYLERWAEPVLGDPLPGDIVLMDTGIENGTVYDHVGVAVGLRPDWAQGRLLVVNNWAPGARTAAMDLTNGVYPTVVGVFRMGPAEAYQEVTSPAPTSR